ncbi:MAG TPA: ATP synthase F0 subunit B [Thermoanaerobaculia bacterium]|nr:ATP synthase F0 subunit B [Thermoanaerobaculia bacterium]
MIKAPDVTLLYVLFAFVVTYFVLRRFLFRPLGGILEARATEEAAAAKVHAESMERLAAEIARAEAELAHARIESLKERETLRAEGRVQLDKKLDQARASAAEILEKATRELAAQTESSSRDLPGRVRQLANALAEKVLGRKLAA